MHRYKSLVAIATRWNMLRSVFHIALYYMSPARALIASDIEKWLLEWRHSELSEAARWKALAFLVSRYPEFRNLFYYRIEHHYHIPSRLTLELAKRTYRRMSTLYIHTPVIGPGLFIQHGFSCIIAAKSIGENCWINQQVTVGYSNGTDCPTIGDNVRIAAGAKVFGRISIGNNVTIGANAVVCKDVPANCTVVGVPGHIVRRNGKKVKEAL